MASHRMVMVLGCALVGVLPGVPCAQPLAEAPTSARLSIVQYVREASHRFGIPEAWIHAVIRIESAGRIRAISAAGAMGLMQLMPGTWARQRDRFGLGRDPFDPRDNIMAGTSYLREMYDRYGAAGFLAAYNAGPGRYEEWRDKGRPLPLETRRYVTAIAPMLQSERMFSAASMQPFSIALAPVPPDSHQAQQLQRGADPDIQANPFAPLLASRHVLFAKVSTVDDPRHPPS